MRSVGVLPVAWKVHFSFLPSYYTREKKRERKREGESEREDSADCRCSNENQIRARRNEIPRPSLFLSFPVRFVGNAANNSRRAAKMSRACPRRDRFFASVSFTSSISRCDRRVAGINPITLQKRRRGFFPFRFLHMPFQEENFFLF